MKILIVEATFYGAIADELAKGAIRAIEKAGGSYERISVPGVFELPAAIRFAADGEGYDGYVALGCVVRGETSHYDYVCTESARGLQDLAIRDRLCIGYGVLTVENKEQAWVRAALDQKDKGKDAVEAALRMIELKNKFGK
jgi:6,7-dimethyl-8-ribityllumazine synthase